MRPLMFTVIAAGALVASVAIAQPAPPDGAPPPPGEMGGPGGHGHGFPGFMRGRHMPPPPKAAVFNFRAGDKSMFVKCADDEPTKTCTDAVAAMMQAINANPAK